MDQKPLKVNFDQQKLGPDLLRHTRRVGPPLILQSADSLTVTQPFSLKRVKTSSGFASMALLNPTRNSSSRVRSYPDARSRSTRSDRATSRDDHCWDCWGRRLSMIFWIFKEVMDSKRELKSDACCAGSSSSSRSSEHFSRVGRQLPRVCVRKCSR